MLSPVTALLGIACLLFILSQFGGRLAARSGLVWWLALGMFMLSALIPQAFRPIADLLGIKLVSNLVMASMIVFLTYQVLEQISVTTKQIRGHRLLVSRLAVEDFISRSSNQPDPESRLGPKQKYRALVVLPCYNEQASLPEVTAQLNGLTSNPDFDIDYCIIDDGSQDGSRALLRQESPRNHTCHMTNIGVAGVLMTGFQIGIRLDVDYIIQCDSDGQHPVYFIPEFLARAHAAKADLFVGSRFLDDPNAHGNNDLVSTTPLRRLGALMILAVLRMFGSATSISDPTSGYRVYSKTIFHNAVTQMPDEYPEPELLALTSIWGGSVKETKVEMTPRSGGTSSIAGLGTVIYMVKVVTALLGLRLRSLRGTKPSMRPGIQIFPLPGSSQGDEKQVADSAETGCQEGDADNYAGEQLDRMNHDGKAQGLVLGDAENGQRHDAARLKSAQHADGSRDHREDGDKNQDQGGRLKKARG
jgi:hypothetical protein